LGLSATGSTQRNQFLKLRESISYRFFFFFAIQTPKPPSSSSSMN